MTKTRKLFNGLASLVLLAMLAAAVHRVDAATGALSWTLPTKNDDGTSLTDISGFKLYRSTTNAMPASPVFTAAPTATSWADTSLLGGTTYFYWIATTTPRGDSTAVGPVSLTTVPSKPMPPTNFTVTGLTAYMVLRQNDRFVALPVGTVPGGTACDPNNGAIAAGVTYYAVPSAAVTWSGTTRPTVVVAPCS